MRIIAVAEKSYHDYLIDIFAKHSECGELSAFAEWEPRAAAYKGKPIISLPDLKQEQYDVLLVAVYYNHHLSRLLSYLHVLKLKNIYIIRLYFLETRKDFISGSQLLDENCVDKFPEEGGKPYLVHLETHVCDQCNLNCKGCNNFSPFVHGRHVTDLVQFEKDLVNLSNMFSIGRLFLLGGEPLLEPEHCRKMIELSRRYFPNSELRLLTNAILAPRMKPEFWSCVRENQVIVHVSVYPPVRPVLQNIEDVFEKYQITYIINRQVTQFERRWTLYPFEDAKLNNDKCWSAGCHYLQNGAISKCPDSVLMGKMAPAMGCAPEELVSSKDSLKLEDYSDPWELIQKLNSPCELCKKCTTDRLKRVKWEPCGGAAIPSEWLLENRLEYENRQLKAQVKKLSAVQTIPSVDEEAKAIRASISYKIGRAMTWLPRKVRSGYRCLKGNGWSYTIHLLTDKVRHIFIRR